VKLAVALALAAAACADERDRPDAAAGGVHPAGSLDPASPDFHGAELAAHGWDLGLCASCHGDDFAGGAAGVSCLACHDAGPTACDTCHEAIPTTGAHANHTATIDCASCHRVPARWDDDGHVRVAGAADPAPAEVVMTGLAAATLDPADRAGPPAFAAGTCTNVYCHGAVLGAAGGVATAPVWAAAPAPAACDRCHGDPPPAHATADCATCHPGAAPGRHLDGAVDLANDAGLGLPACSGCHGGATSPAPPRDLAGATVIGALGVGAHQAHLTGPRLLAAPIACAACHAVPATTTAAGHVDTALPAEVDATLGWDRATATCATAWCHGPARPRWTETGEVSCGTCHAIPPATPAHPPDLPLTACASCHPQSVDAFGNILFAGAATQHLDGDVDAP
jgi:predicted CxxxxCH...CXXCH cytochrome family protein